MYMIYNSTEASDNKCFQRTLRRSEHIWLSLLSVTSHKPFRLLDESIMKGKQFVDGSTRKVWCFSSFFQQLKQKQIL